MSRLPRAFGPVLVASVLACGGGTRESTPPLRAGSDADVVTVTFRLGPPIGDDADRQDVDVLVDTRPPTAVHVAAVMGMCRVLDAETLATHQGMPPGSAALACEMYGDGQYLVVAPLEGGGWALRTFVEVASDADPVEGPPEAPPRIEDARVLADVAIPPGARVVARVDPTVE